MKASKVKTKWSRWRGSELAEVGRLRERLEAQLRSRLLEALSEGVVHVEVRCEEGSNARPHHLVLSSTMADLLRREEP